MSLYYLQKLLYQLNRDPELQQEFLKNKDSVLAKYTLNDEELDAIRTSNVGLLYVLGVNGQLLMHFAAMCGYAWPEYIEAMRDGVNKYGNVRAGIYAMTDGKGAI